MKKEPKLVIMFFSLIIGIILAIQLKTKVDMYIPATLTALQNTRNELKIVNKDIENFSEVIKEKEKRLYALKNISEEEELLEILKEDIEKNMRLSGITNLEGPGIIISMYDNEEVRVEDHNFDFEFDINDDIIHDIDILNIVNDLRIAGAEAISINNERVVSTSDIKCGGPIIRINGRSSGTPFIIKAIGDPVSLNAAVNAPNTYGDTLKNVLNKGFDTFTEDSIVIPKYDMPLNNFKYAKPSEGEE